MKNKFKVNFAVKSQNDKSKPALIYIMWTWDKRYKMSIGQSVIPEYWDKENECAVISSTQTQALQRSLKRLNRFIEDLKKRMSTELYSYVAFKNRQDSVCGSMIKFKISDIVNGIQKTEEEETKKATIRPSEYFKNYADNVCNKVVKRTGTFRCSGTQTNHYVVLKRYTEYLQYSKNADTFAIFTEKFEADFERWCLAVKGYTPNTVAGSFSIFKLWLNDAEREGLIKDPAFHHYKTKAIAPQHQYLTTEEIQRIYNIKWSKKLKLEYGIDLKSHIEETRDLFVIACNLGLRLGDWKYLNNAVWDFDNNTVDIITSKTKERVVIPISSMVKEIYQRYNGKFPKPTDKTTLNRQIQRCCRVAGIDQDVYVLETVNGVATRKKYKKYELITSHSGRRSFATNLYLRCKNAKMVMSFTGHKTEENFFKYICVAKEENAQLAQQFFD